MAKFGELEWLSHEVECDRCTAMQKDFDRQSAGQDQHSSLGTNASQTIEKCESASQRRVEIDDQQGRIFFLDYAPGRRQG